MADLLHHSNWKGLLLTISKQAIVIDNLLSKYFASKHIKKKKKGNTLDSCFLANYNASFISWQIIHTAIFFTARNSNVAVTFIMSTDTLSG